MERSDIGQINVPTSRRIDSIQGLRAVAFVGIFISHSYLGSYEAFGVWGVSVFLVLSGFLMSYAWLQKEIKPENAIRFAIKKIMKLYPLHIAMMIMCALPALYKVIFGKTSAVKLIIDIVLHSSLTQVWVPYSKYYQTLNGPAWYLSVMVFLYLMFPLLLKTIKKTKSTRECIIKIFVLYAVQFIIAEIARMFGSVDRTAMFSCQWIVYFCPLSRLVDFMIGSYVGWLFIHAKENIRWKCSWIFELVILAITTVSIYLYITETTVLSSEWIKYTLLFTPSSVLLIWVVARGGIIAKVLNNRVLIWVGNLSPYTFLIHKVVIKYVDKVSSFIIRKPVNAVVLAIFSFAVTVLLALIYQYVERKVRNMKLFKSKNMSVQKNG